MNNGVNNNAQTLLIVKIEISFKKSKKNDPCVCVSRPINV